MPDDDEELDETITHPKGDEPAGPGSILDHDGSDFHVNPNKPVDPYHQSSSPDLRQIRGQGERILAKYLGPSVHSRQLLVKEVQDQLGVKVEHDLVWDKFNSWTLDVTHEPKTVINYLAELDGNFAVWRVNADDLPDDEPTG